MKNRTKPALITWILVLSICLIVIGLIASEEKKPVFTELRGTVTLKNDQFVLQSGKTKTVLAILPSNALDSLKFRPQNMDELVVVGYKNKGSFVCVSAIWKEKLFTFRDSLNHAVIPSRTTWTVDKKKCISCRLCVNNCPANAITMVEISKGQFKAEIDQTKCLGCNVCIVGNSVGFAGCPVKAISK